MRTFKYLVLFLCFMILGCGTVKKNTDISPEKNAPPGYQQKVQPKNVIVVVIDGARYSEGFGSMEDVSVTNNTMPYMYSMLSQAAIMKKLYVGDPSRLTETNASHATIATGVFSNIRNDGSERPHAPTIFEYFRKQTGAAPTSCYVIMGKDKLGIINASDTSDYGSAIGASSWTSGMDPAWTGSVDDTVWKNTQTILNRDHPQLCMINLPLTDWIGHGEFAGDSTPENDNGGSAYTNYLNAIRSADQIVQNLWNFIQSDPTYKDKTTLIVTHDHGRHSNSCSDGLRSHAGPICSETNDAAGIGTCDGVQQLFLFAMGPGIKKGAISTTAHNLQDIAPTVGELMGFTLPSANGVVIQEILK